MFKETLNRKLLFKSWSCLPTRTNQKTFCFPSSQKGTLKEKERKKETKNTNISCGNYGVGVCKQKSKPSNVHLEQR